MEGWNSRGRRAASVEASSVESLSVCVEFPCYGVSDSVSCRKQSNLRLDWAHESMTALECPRDSTTLAVFAVETRQHPSRHGRAR
jgi:hypothetical protein